MYKKTIVIPVYKHWDLAGELLRGLHKHEKDNIDEILIVDDCSKDVNVDEGVKVLSAILPISILRNEKNLGFTISANMGLRHVTQGFAEKKIVFLISTDVKISGRFIDQTVNILDNPRRHLVGGKLLFGDTGWNTFDGKTFQYLEGWFLAAQADHWRDLGYFDDNFAPHDYEDIDLSTRALASGFKLVPLNSPFIKHLGAGSIGYNPEREAITRRNREYFRNKWDWSL